MYIVFEGIDGAGKGTLLQMLVDRLSTEYSSSIVQTKVPGGTPLGMELREVMFHKIKTQNMAPYVVDALFLADWLQTSQQVVDPALRQGKIVIQDRSVYSQPAYGIDRPTCPVLSNCFQVHHGATPDLIFLLFGTPAHLLGRAKGRAGKEGEKQDGKAWAKTDSMRQIQDAYIRTLGGNPAVRIVPVDVLSPDEVFEDYIWPNVSVLFRSWLRERSEAA